MSKCLHDVKTLMYMINEHNIGQFLSAGLTLTLAAPLLFSLRLMGEKDHPCLSSAEVQAICTHSLIFELHCCSDILRYTEHILMRVCVFKVCTRTIQALMFTTLSIFSVFPHFLPFSLFLALLNAMPGSCATCAWIWRHADPRS